MRQTKMVIYILSALLLLAAAYFGIQEAEQIPPFSFSAGGEEIQSWENEEGNCFVFLPSYAELSEVRVRTKKPLHLDELVLTDGMNCEEVELGRVYILSNGAELTFLSSQNVPALYINTSSSNMEYIHQNKENREPGSLRLYTPEGKLDYSGDLETIKSRGNSTFFRKKKPYSVTLSRDGDLLGMGAAKKWILLANAMDQSQIKNKFAYDFAKEIGLPFSPESQWVDLYLNGSYAGLYLLCERNEIHPQRVDISKKESFLVSKEQMYLYVHSDGKTPYIATDAEAYLRVRSNSLGEDNLKAIIQSAENAIMAKDGVDPVTGKHWTELIDPDSWARKYLIEEIFDGIDAGIASQFFFYQNGLIYAGPVWDYDDTMGVGIWLGDSIPYLWHRTDLFYAHRAYECPWFHSLYYDDIFYSKLTSLYREEVSQILKEFLEDRIVQYEAHIKKSARMDQIRWNGPDASELIAFIQSYLTDRMNFLSKVWAEDSNHIEIHVDYTYAEFECWYAIYDLALTPGDCVPELPTPENYIWYIADKGVPLNFDQPVYESMTIQLRPDSEE